MGDDENQKLDEIIVGYAYGRKGDLNINYLHGDADEEEEVKFKQADDNLVPSVHCYRRIASDRMEMRTTRMVYFS